MVKSLKPVFDFNEIKTHLGCTIANKNVYALINKNLNAASVYHEFTTKLPTEKIIDTHCITCTPVDLNDLSEINFINLRRISSNVSSLINFAITKQNNTTEKRGVRGIINAINNDFSLIDVLFALPEFLNIRYIALPVCFSGKLITLVVERNL